jgi:hypothetical protein
MEPNLIKIRKFFVFVRLITDWLVKNMNPDMTPNRMSLDVSVSPERVKDTPNNATLVYG